MPLFNRKPKATPEADPEALLEHIVGVAMKAALEGTKESADEAAEHLATDLSAQPAHVLAAALGMAAIMEGEACARDIRSQAKRLADDLFGHLFGAGAPEAAQEPAGAAETPQADEEAQDAPDPLYEAGVARLARSLYQHVYGPSEPDDETWENYLADARDIALSHPHLLNAAERGLTEKVWTEDRR